MRKRTIGILVAVAIALYAIHYYVNPIAYAFYTFNAYDEALGQLARAESAQTPQEVVEHVIAAKLLLPQSGSVSWWSAENVSFEQIQARLDDIVIRAESISSLRVEDERYNTEMYAIHEELARIQETLIIF